MQILNDITFIQIGKILKPGDSRNNFDWNRFSFSINDITLKEEPDISDLTTGAKKYHYQDPAASISLIPLVVIYKAWYERHFNFKSFVNSASTLLTEKQFQSEIIVGKNEYLKTSIMFYIYRLSCMLILFFSLRNIPVI